MKTLGGLPNVFTAYQRVDNPTVRATFEQAWGVPLNPEPGLTATEMVDGAADGRVRAMFVLGENPMMSEPNQNHARHALEELEFLVCQDIFINETGAMADVILPATSFAEKDGTFTNTEGLVQPVRTAIDPIGESRPDWEILSTLSVLMGYPIEYGDAKEIFKEIRSVIPGYALLGPVPTPPRPDADAVAQYLERGYAEDVLQRYRVHTREADVKGKGGAKTLALVLTQSLFHSGKFSTRAKGLLQVEATGKLALNPLDAERWSLGEGDPVRVANERGEMITTVTLRDRLLIR